MGEIKSIADIIKDISPYYKEKGAPEAEHKLIYDSSSETLEPVYFFILDLMEESRMSPEKLIDNFSSSPGSGHFAELGQRATIMQQQGAKILADVNTVLRSVLNVIYDLKDFKIRLQSYNDLKSPKKERAEAALLSLKQIWMDKVDINKGGTSIKQLAFSQAGFQTLIDAFLVVKNADQAKKLDLNERVQRIVAPRIEEFNIWVKASEQELRKRYELEKTYLKSQVNALKLYSRWARPYLRAASQLEPKDFGRDPALVNVFNTLILELTLIGKQELKPKEASLEGDLPSDFTNEKFINSLKRKYYTCVLVDFRFRGIPQKAGQHYVFGGKAEMTFRGYALNNEELDKLNKELEKSDLTEALSLAEGVTTESLEHMQSEIKEFLEEKDLSEEKKPSSDGSNPFLALIGYYDKGDGSSEKKKSMTTQEIIVKKDNWIEKEHLRRLSAKRAEETAFKLFDLYKKAHGMVSYQFS
ncbi:MAG TPA: hypothetical protein VJH92_05420 [Candidatus Nanoarchaeia archaeon]|nr:hypothetical protein [Candidatus Nanoarchaeia archaeon]